jgi:hypothetical protein
MQIHKTFTNEVRSIYPCNSQGGSCGCEVSRLLHLLYSRHIDGGEVSLTRRLPFTIIKLPGTHFVLGNEYPKDIARQNWLGQLKKNPLTSSGMEPHTFRFVVCWLHQLRYRVLGKL